MKFLTNHYSLATLLVVIGVGTLPTPVRAAAITYTYQHHLFTIQSAQHPAWRHAKREWLYRGVPATPPARLLTCGRDDTVEPGWTSKTTADWNDAAIARTLATEISSKLDRSAGSVVISRNATGSIVFDGVGLPGRTVDIARAVALTKAALDSGIGFVVLPVTETQPAVRVTDPELLASGIRELVTVGESVFAGSPVNRRHNIGVGLRRFSGHRIPQGSVFSFDETLGPVNERTGYRKELVIQGETTLPDYGGGLCQVSTTAYRGPWEYGMPIMQRKNHSYAVRYYSPQGTDATIYPPNVDMKFLNNTPGDMLIQTHMDDQDRAYFIYYGTRDARRNEVIGPFVWGSITAPAEERTVYTTEIPPGEKRKAGERHDGMKVEWFRVLQMAGTGQTIEQFFSGYEARPLYWQIGVEAGDSRLPTGPDDSGVPSWIPTSR